MFLFARDPVTVKTILSIAFAAGFMLMPTPGLDFRTRIGLETSVASAGVDPISLPGDLKMPADSTDVVYEGLGRRMAVHEFYRRRAGTTCWIGIDGLSILGDSLVTTIRSIRYFGLLPQQYHLKELEQ